MYFLFTLVHAVLGKYSNRCRPYAWRMTARKDGPYPPYGLKRINQLVGNQLPTLRSELMFN